jgi:nucleoside-triphosphatase THEP1
METIKENEKSIFSEIIYNKRKVEKPGQTIEYTSFFSHKIESNTVSQIIETAQDEIIKIANEVSKNCKKFFEENQAYVSEQQIDFYKDCTSLILSNLKVNNPILIPVRCGFGKSTFLKTLIGTLIYKTRYGFSSSKISDDYLPMIITTDRISDLKELSKAITKKYGYYNQFDYVDSETQDLVTKRQPYIYVLEGWNKGINCRNYKKVTKYAESIERCTPERCAVFSECELGIQRKEQLYSPILAMTNTRLSYLTNIDNPDKGVSRYTTFIDKDKEEMTRSRLLIDEKPKLFNNNIISIDEIGKMKSIVNNYDPLKDETNNHAKLSMIKELHNIESKILEIQEEYKDYRNAFIVLDEEIFSSNFRENWFGFFGYKYVKYINALEDMFRNGALLCNAKNNMFFYTVSRNKFNVADLKTFIFDGTAEMSLEYKSGGNDFIYLNIDDYKKYDYVTFHTIQENFSRDAIKKRPKKLKAVCDFIKNEIKDKTYVISYRECNDIPVNDLLTDYLKENQYIVLCKDTNKLPYFGNTKGKNDWSSCSNMVQVGWNRYNSDIYIAEYLSSSSTIKKQIKERYESFKYKIPELLFGLDEGGKFKFHELEQYRLMKMIVDFEQEAFRTSIREFSSNKEVHIYIFSVSDAMRSMIWQRFSKCKFIEHKGVKEFEEFRKMDRKGNEDIERLIKWIDTVWNQKKIESKKVKELNKISDDSWTYVFNKDKGFQKMLKERRVKQKKEGSKYYLIKY